MKAFPLLLIALFLTFSCAQSKEKVEKVYQDNCAMCHGKDLNGGLGGSLIDGEWRYGDSAEEIYHSIAKGRPTMDMPAMEDMLTSQQIHALVVYIREQEAKAQQQPEPEPQIGNVTETQHHSYVMEEVVPDGLKLPWGMAFLPDGRMLITERPGSLRVAAADGTLVPEPVADTPAVIHHGQGGMMAVAPHPQYSDNGWIYLAFSDGWQEEGQRRPKCLTAVVRGRLQDNRWVDQEWIYKADKEFYTSSGVHFGTRIVFQDEYLFFIVGERGGKQQALDISRPNGKVFRLFHDGSVPPDNPFVDQEGALPGIWTYGHRNPQGMSIDPRNGDIYVTEHGPRGGDELNLIRKGSNYGWPEATHGMNYNGTPITDKVGGEGIAEPILHWTPSIAPCGLAFYTGDAFPQWQNDLFAGSLRNQTLRRLRLQDQEVVEQEVVIKGAGRIRQVVDGPDGNLYVVLNAPDRVVRLVPAE